MGVRFPGAGTNQPFGAALSLNVEGIILTSLPLNISLPFQQVLIWWTVMLTLGTTLTAITFRLRRGTTLVSPLLTTQSRTDVAPGQTITVSGCYFDTPGEVAGIQYVFTGQQTGAGTGTSNLDGAIITMAM